ncbi:TonB-dependent receptor [Caenimonas sedimenti]|uniref:TonB-dependent receptor n=1 Tax=Caenimonas sedimenti TaxID=2596921 RepID=UPI001C9394A1|nr:TonB-dependent receptor [Caenimonas sedimenti]
MIVRRFGAFSVTLSLGLVVPLQPASAQTSGELKPVTIQSTREDLQGSATSASEGVVTSKQLRTRPVLRAGDIMEAVPGLVATQHAGEGKANQYFMRGFNLDHGTDLATFVDGVPINFPTHGHGQGYTDLYFLIPELVDSVQYRKGPYYAQEGDFATAGSVRIRTLRKLEQPFGLLEIGRFGYRRILAAGSVVAGGGDLLFAAERGGDDGPWTVSQDLRKTNLTAKYSLGTPDNGLVLGATHYEASWISTDQVPKRAIDNGTIGRFDTLDPTAGGRTRRTGINGEWTRSEGGVQTAVSAYALRYSFDLFSNFSYYTRGCDADPLPAACNGNVALDQFEQVDRRNVFGLGARQSRPLKLGGLDGQLSFGADLRRDNVGEVGLYDTFQRARTSTVRSDEVQLTALGLWGQAELQLTPQWQAIAGLRWDQRDIDVTSSVAANSGSTRASRASPKASLIYSPSDRLDLYANWGRGFHSNDARGTVIRVDPRDGVTPVERATPLAPATGYEIGARQKWGTTLTTTAALWALDLDSELLFVGDAGTTEASRPSRRRGIELTANWRPAPAWEVDADLSLTRARFGDSDPAGDRIPGAMERVATLGITYVSGPWTVGARVRHFGAHPLIEDNSIRGEASTLVNTRVSYRFSRAVELSLDVFNLFDRRASDVQYAYASRLPGEPAFADGVTPASVHLHPSMPRTVRVGVKVSF